MVPSADIFPRQNMVLSPMWSMSPQTLCDALILTAFSSHDLLHVASLLSDSVSIHMLLLFLNGTFNITLTMVCAVPALSTNKSRSV